MLLTSHDLNTLFPQKNQLSNDVKIEAVTIDSREKCENSLFVPIIGERFDGHEFLAGAIDNGAQVVLWDENRSLPENLKEKCHVIYVDDTLKALQKLAEYYRNKINPIVIGITGSNGKTTTKDIVSSILETTYKTHKTAGNYNNDIGLPLTILSMPVDTEVLVLEMGMNHFGEIDLLTRLSTPDHAIITNIGESHIEFLGSKEGIAEAKLEIVNGLSDSGSLVIDGDEPLLSSLFVMQEVIACGFNKNDTVNRHIQNVEVSLSSTRFTLDGKKYEIPLTGAHHAKNASYAIVLAERLDVKEENIKEGLLGIEHSEMRFEKVLHSSGATIINDTYNASPTSVVAAINVIKSMGAYPKKILVLGDIFELGDHASEFHQEIGESITDPITGVYTLGNYAEIITRTVHVKEKQIPSKHLNNEESLIEALEKDMDGDTIVLFKASRGMAFEKIIEKLIKNIKD